MVFLEKSDYFLLFQHEQVIISQHKSTELINIYWFGHSSLLLFSNIRHKTAIFPVLQKLTHICCIITSKKRICCVITSITVSVCSLTAATVPHTRSKCCYYYDQIFTSSVVFSSSGKSCSFICKRCRYVFPLDCVCFVFHIYKQ